MFQSRCAAARCCWLVGALLAVLTVVVDGRFCVTEELFPNHDDYNHDDSNYDTVTIPADCTRLVTNCIKIGETGAIALANALETNTVVTHLNLEESELGNNGVVALAEMLKTNTVLTWLNFNWNDVEDTGAIALANALDGNTAVTYLSLYKNKIGATGATALAKTLETNNALATLRLIYNDIGANGAIALANALETNTALTKLDLQACKIGATGATALAKKLESNTALVDLNVGQNDVGDTGAIAFAEMLETNDAITKLDLQYNNIGANGAIALANALEINTAVSMLRLDGNDEIGDRAVFFLTTVTNNKPGYTYNSGTVTDFTEMLGVIQTCNSHGTAEEDFTCTCDAGSGGDVCDTLAIPTPFPHFTGCDSHVQTLHFSTKEDCDLALPFLGLMLANTVSFSDCLPVEPFGSIKGWSPAFGDMTEGNLDCEKARPFLNAMLPDVPEGLEGRCGGGKSSNCAVGDSGATDGETWSLTAELRMPSEPREFRAVSNPDAGYTIAKCTAECEDLMGGCIGFVETLKFNGVCVLVVSAGTSLDDVSASPKYGQYNWYAKPKPEPRWYDDCRFEQPRFGGAQTGDLCTSAVPHMNALLDECAAYVGRGYGENFGACGTDEYNADGTCLGCTPCSNTDCGAAYYRSGECSGATDGYTCTPCTNAVVKEGTNGTCTCNDGWASGSGAPGNCTVQLDDVDVPVFGPNGVACANGGVATDDATTPNDGMFTCDCALTAFSGSNCEVPLPPAPTTATDETDANNATDVEANTTLPPDTDGSGNGQDVDVANTAGSMRIGGVQLFLLAIVSVNVLF